MFQKMARRFNTGIARNMRKLESKIIREGLRFYTQLRSKGQYTFIFMAVKEHNDLSPYLRCLLTCKMQILFTFTHEGRLSIRPVPFEQVYSQP